MTTPAALRMELAAAVARFAFPELPAKDVARAFAHDAFDLSPLHISNVQRTLAENVKASLLAVKRWRDHPRFAARYDAMVAALKVIASAPAIVEETKPAHAEERG